MQAAAPAEGHGSGNEIHTTYPTLGRPCGTTSESCLRFSRTESGLPREKNNLPTNGGFLASAPVPTPRRALQIKGSMCAVSIYKSNARRCKIKAKPSNAMQRDKARQCKAMQGKTRCKAFKRSKRSKAQQSTSKARRGAHHSTTQYKKATKSEASETMKQRQGNAMQTCKRDRPAAGSGKDLASPGRAVGGNPVNHAKPCTPEKIVPNMFPLC